MASEGSKGYPRGPAADSAALKRMIAARRQPTQIGTAVECLRTLKEALDREYDKAKDETGILAYAKELADRALSLAGIGLVF